MNNTSQYIVMRCECCKGVGQIRKLSELKQRKWIKRGKKFYCPRPGCQVAAKGTSNVSAS